MGVFVAGSSRSHQPEPSAGGVGLVSVARGRCSLEAAARQDLFLSRGERTVASLHWSQGTCGEVRDG